MTRLATISRCNATSLPVNINPCKSPLFMDVRAGHTADNKCSIQEFEYRDTSEGTPPRQRASYRGQQKVNDEKGRQRKCWLTTQRNRLATSSQSSYVQQKRECCGDPWLPKHLSRHPYSSNAFCSVTNTWYSSFCLTIKQPIYKFCFNWKNNKFDCSSEFGSILSFLHKFQFQYT